MEWYYAIDQQQHGPVPESEFEDLIRNGTITPTTLVWRDGMADWQPLAEVRPGTPPPPGPESSAVPVVAAAAVPTAVCSQCGRTVPTDQTIQVAGQPVCAACKPTYLQKLREGVSTSARREDLEQVLAVAKAQKGVIWCILAGVICYAVMFTLMGVSGGQPTNWILVPQLAGLVTLGFQVVYVYRLAAALKYGMPLLWVLGIVCLSCIGLLLMLILSGRATKTIRAAGFKVGVMGADLRAIEAALG